VNENKQRGGKEEKEERKKEKRKKKTEFQTHRFAMMKK